MAGKTHRNMYVGMYVSSRVNPTGRAPAGRRRESSPREILLAVGTAVACPCQRAGGGQLSGASRGTVLRERKCVCIREVSSFQGCP